MNCQIRKRSDMVTMEADKAKKTTEQDVADILEHHIALLRYLNNLAHRMRTPLTVMKSYSELVLAGIYGSVEGEIEDKIRYIDHAMDELSTMVDQMEDFREIQDMEVEAVSERIDVVGLVEKTSYELGMEYDVENDLEIRSQREEMVCFLNPHRTQRALSHLIRLAMDRTKGPVKIELLKEYGRLVVRILGDIGPVNIGEVDTMVDRITAENDHVGEEEWRSFTLFLARSFMRMQGGDVKVVDTGGDKAFELSMLCG